VKNFLPPAAAEFSLLRHIIFEISLREISKMMCLSKDNLARSAKKTFYTTPDFLHIPRLFTQQKRNFRLEIKRKQTDEANENLFTRFLPFPIFTGLHLSG
jgi:hypothetical protein